MQVAVSEELIKFLAKLGKVSLSEDQVKKYQQDLREIINYVSMVGQMQTAKVKAKFHTTDKKNTFKTEKHPNQTLSQEEVLQNAPKAQKGMFVVPRVIRK